MWQIQVKTYLAILIHHLSVFNIYQRVNIFGFFYVWLAIKRIVPFFPHKRKLKLVKARCKRRRSEKSILGFFFTTKNLFISIPWLLVCVCVWFNLVKSDSVCVVCVFVSVKRKRERERERSVSVCACVWLRVCQTESERLCVCLWANMKKKKESVCVCV